MAKMTGDLVRTMLIDGGATTRDAEQAAKLTDECWAMSIADLFNAMQGATDSIAKMIAEQVLKQRCFEILNAVK